MPIATFDLGLALVASLNVFEVGFLQVIRRV